MDSPLYPKPSADLAKQRAELAPDALAAFKAFSKAVFADGALPEQTKQLIAVAVAHTTQCPYCIRGHTRLARRKGATDEQIMEAVQVIAMFNMTNRVSSALGFVPNEEYHRQAR